VSRRHRPTDARRCQGKRAHTTSDDAEQLRDALIAAGTCPDAIEVYRCRRCRLWHVGHIVGLTKWRP
jgi:hypothetical protein